MDFGSREWQEYYHGRNNGHRAIADQAQRARAAMRLATSARGEKAELDRRAAEAEAEAHALEAWERDCESLAQEFAADETRAAPGHNLGRDRALTVQIRGQLPESITVGLLSNGWRWSHRRGGMWWAPRNEESLAIARALCV